MSMTFQMQRKTRLKVFYLCRRHFRGIEEVKSMSISYNHDAARSEIALTTLCWLQSQVHGIAQALLKSLGLLQSEVY